MSSYKIEKTVNGIMSGDVTTLTVSFGTPAANDKIVVDAAAALAALAPLGGAFCLVTGPASLPVAFVLAHALLHNFQTIGVFDPKLQKFVCVSSHGGDHKVGDLL